MGLNLLAHVQLPALECGIQGVAGIGVDPDLAYLQQPIDVVTALFMLQGGLNKTITMELAAFFFFPQLSLFCAFGSSLIILHTRHHILETVTWQWAISFAAP